MAAADPEPSLLDKVRLVLDYAPAEALADLAASDEELALLANLDRRIAREVTARRVTRARVIVERPVPPPPAPEEIPPAGASDLLVFATPAAGEPEPASAVLLTPNDDEDVPAPRALEPSVPAQAADAAPLVLRGAVGNPADWEPAWDVEVPAEDGHAPGDDEEPDDFTLQPASPDVDGAADGGADLEDLGGEEAWPEQEDAFEIVSWPEAVDEDEVDLDEEPVLDEPAPEIEEEPRSEGEPEVAFTVEPDDADAEPEVGFTMVEDEDLEEDLAAEASSRTGSEEQPDEEEDLLAGLLDAPEPGSEPEAPPDDGAEEEPVDLADLDLPEVEEEQAPAPEPEEPPEPPGEDSVTRLEGVGTIYADRLRDAGVGTMSDLLGVDPWRTSQETGIASALLERWVAVADLVHEGSVPLAYAEVLAQVGIGNAEELREADAEDLARRVNDHLAARQDPDGPGPVTAEDVTAWQAGS